MEWLILAGFPQFWDTDALLVSSKIRSAEDLTGRTIAAPAGSTSHYQLLFFIEFAKIPNVTVLLAQPADFSELWQKGQVDGVWVWEPWLQGLKQEFSSAHILTSGAAVAPLGAGTFISYVLRSGSLPFEVVRDVLRTVHACNSAYDEERWGPESQQVEGPRIDLQWISLQLFYRYATSSSMCSR